MDIPDIRINNIAIDDIDVTPITVRIPPVAPVYNTVPVTVDVGVPIVNMPGCVEASRTGKPPEKKWCSF